MTTLHKHNVRAHVLCINIFCSVRWWKKDQRISLAEQEAIHQPHPTWHQTAGLLTPTHILYTHTLISERLLCFHTLQSVSISQILQKHIITATPLQAL